MAAEEIGDVIEEPVLNADGKPSGRVKLLPSGNGGPTASKSWN
jgi:hypothetical protein